MKFLRPVALALAVGCCAASAQGTVAGQWELTLTTPQGDTTVNLTLAEETPGKLTGHLNSPLGALNVTGTDTAGAVVLAARLDFQGNVMDLGLNGKLQDESLAGTVKIGDFGEFPFTGKRVSATAAPAVGAATAPAAPPTDANGTWNIVLSLGGAADFPLSATLKQDGERVSGTLTSMAGEVVVSGTMIGKVLKLDLTVPTPQGPLPITMTGELGAAGFRGKATASGLGEADWTATRVQ